MVSYSNRDKDLFCFMGPSLCSDISVQIPTLALLGMHCSPIFLMRKQRPEEVMNTGRRTPTLGYETGLNSTPKFISTLNL